MLKKFIIYLIIISLFILFLTDSNDDFTDSKDDFTNSNKSQIVNKNNYVMNEKSIVRSSNTNLTKIECFNKINKRDINGASYNLINNICTLYFFAEKGTLNKDVESIIL